MQDYSSLTNVYFIDVETVSQSENYTDLDDKMKKFWDAKSESISKEKTAEEIYDRAAIYSEFGKIVCISIGYIRQSNDAPATFIAKSFYGDDEEKLLTDFAKMLHNQNIHTLCGHNIKEFDIPYICRRMLINGIKIPPLINVQGRKPWEIPFIDTLEMWKFGDYKHFTSLDLLTHIFGIKSPKGDINGSEVHDVYYKEHDLQRIWKYCEQDILASAQVLLSLRGMEHLDNENFISKTE